MTIGKADGIFSGGKLEYGETIDQYIEQELRKELEEEFRRKKSWRYGLRLSKNPSDYALHFVLYRLRRVEVSRA